MSVNHENIWHVQLSIYKLYTVFVKWTKKRWYAYFNCRYTPCISYYLNNRNTYLNHRNTYLNHRNTYLNNRNTYLNHRNTYLNNRNTYLNNRNTYLNNRNTYLNNRNTYLNNRNTYLKYKLLIPSYLTASLSINTHFVHQHNTVCSIGIHGHWHVDCWHFKIEYV